MQLFILRHGLAEEGSAISSGGDSQRRLTAEGKTKMLRAARGMKSLEMEMDLILTSPFLRAKETAEIVAEAFGLEKVLHLVPALAADGNPKELVDHLKHQQDKHSNILMVGHEPYLSRLISLLISGETGVPITMRKGGLCKLNVGSLHYGRCATLEWLLTSRQLRSLE